jgi:hypothetical protein
MADVNDPKAMLARLEHAIELFRTKHICDGWKMDEAGAERSLRYFRAGCPDDDDEWGATIAFISSHGLSFDWICGGDVSSMICMLASRSRQAMQAPDPIFAAIEAHKRAYAALDACLGRKSKLEEQFMDAVADMQDKIERYHQLKALEAADPEWCALEKQTLELHDAEEETILGMIEDRPHTLAGAAALLRHVVDQERRGNEWPRGLQEEETGFDNEDWATFLHRNIAEVIEAAARA